MIFEKFSRLSIIFFLCLITQSVLGQSPERTVISSAGESFEEGKFQMEWTLGEPVIGTTTGQNNVITQGFHQTIFVISTVGEVTPEFPELTIFPNPASTHFFMEVTNIQSSRVEFVLSDINGNMVDRGVITKTRHRFDLQYLANTTYILTVTIPELELSRSFKIQKTQ